MKIKLILSLLLLFSIQIFSQSIQFVSEVDNEPLAKVIVFNGSGDILATSDIEGKIEKESLMPPQEKYVLVFDGYNIANLSAKDFENNIITLQPKVKEIEEIVIEKTKPSKYMYIKGNFNVYMLVNKQLNVYADGIVTYVFDNKSKKLKSTKIEQYRVFLKSSENQDRKNVGSLVFDTALEVPELKRAFSKLENNDKKDRYKKIDMDDKTKMQYAFGFLEGKSLKLLGYEFSDFDYLSAIIFNKDSQNLRDFLDYNEIYNCKVKHKSESNFHQLTRHSNFTPTEIRFGDSDDLPKIKLKTDESSYTFEYWKSNSFPNMQPVFSSFFKDALQEKPNNRK